MTTNRVALPREFKTAKQRKLRNSLVIGAVLFAAIAGPIALAFAVPALSNASRALDVVENTGEAIYRPFAEAAAARWAFEGPADVALSAEVATLAGQGFGRPRLEEDDAKHAGLSHDGESSMAPVSLDVVNITWVDAEVTSGPRGTVIELHRFVLTTRNGAFWLTIPVAETEPTPDLTEAGLDAPVPVLGGAPAVEPYTIDARSQDAPAADWAEDDDVQAEPAVATRIAEWAAAFAADDRQTLYDLTGDQGQYEYRGLGGFIVLDRTISGFGTPPDVEDALMARLTLRMVNDAGVVLVADYDLLVSEPRVARPHVVAWGPRGAGPTLTPYQNAQVPGSKRSNGLDPREVDHTLPDDVTPQEGAVRALAEQQSAFAAANDGSYADSIATLLGHDALALEAYPEVNPRDLKVHVMEEPTGFCIEWSPEASDDVLRFDSVSTPRVAAQPCQPTG